MPFSKGITFLLFTAFFMASCGSSESVSGSKSTKKENDGYFDNWEKQWHENWKKGARQVSQTMNEMRQVMSGKNKIEPISPERLKNFLPTRFEGMAPIDSTAEKTELWGIRVSEASVVFQQSSANWKIKLSITDLGSLAGMTTLIRKEWIKNDVNMRTEKGYQKTITYKGFRGLEAFNRSNKTLKYEVIVHDHLLVEVQGKSAYPHKIREALEQINWPRLKDLFDKKGVAAQTNVP